MLQFEREVVEQLSRQFLMLMKVHLYSYIWQHVGLCLALIVMKKHENEQS